MTTYPVPTAPADVEAAALDLIVRLPVEVLHPEFPHLLTDVLQDYCGVLHVEGAFAGLLWADAKNIAAMTSLKSTFCIAFSASGVDRMRSACNASLPHS